MVTCFFSGNYFEQDIIAIPNNLINIYCVYELQPNRLLDQLFLLYKMLYLELCKLLKMLILQNTSTKDMVFVLTKQI